MKIDAAVHTIELTGNELALIITLPGIPTVEQRSLFRESVSRIIEKRAPGLPVLMALQGMEYKILRRSDMCDPSELRVAADKLDDQPKVAAMLRSVADAQESE